MTIDLAQATHESFADLVGQAFEVRTSAGAVVLTLDNIKLFPASALRDNRLEVDGRVLPARAAFALTFEGPREPMLESGSYDIHHPDTGTMWLLLSPFRRDHDCMLYECVFN